MATSPKDLEELVHLNIRVPRGLRENFVLYCSDNGMSLTQGVRLALSSQIDRSVAAPEATRDQASFVQAVNHVSTAATALSELAKLVKKG